MSLSHTSPKPSPSMSDWGAGLEMVGQLSTSSETLSASMSEDGFWQDVNMTPMNPRTSPMLIFLSALRSKRLSYGGSPRLLRSTGLNGMTSPMLTLVLLLMSTGQAWSLASSVQASRESVAM